MPEPPDAKVMGEQVNPASVTGIDTGKVVALTLPEGFETFPAASNAVTA